MNGGYLNNLDSQNSLAEPLQLQRLLGPKRTGPRTAAAAAVVLSLPQARGFL